jgi:hypothetical protein
VGEADALHALVVPHRLEREQPPEHGEEDALAEPPRLDRDRGRLAHPDVHRRSAMNVTSVHQKRICGLRPRVRP